MKRKMKKSIDAAGTINVLLIVSLWFCASSLVIADQKNEENEVFYLEEAMKPLFIAVNDTYCFIGERFSIFQYTVKDFKFIKKFGGKGQGPGQFPVILDMHTTPEYLIVSSLSRVYIYSKDGEYVSEKKTSAWSTRFDMAGGHFLGMGSLEENKIGYETIELLNEDLSKNKELYRYKKILQGSGPINPLLPDPYFAFVGENILISSQDDRILLFNNKGEEKGEMKLNLEKKTIPEVYKEKYFDSFKKNPRKKMFYEMLKNRLEMPKYFPAIKFIMVDGSLVYLVTHQEKDQKILCLVLNLKGEELARAWIPLPPLDAYCHPLAFYKGTCYYLKDDIEKEKWMMIKEQICKVPGS